MTRYVVKLDYFANDPLVFGPFTSLELAEQFRSHSKICSELDEYDSCEIYQLQDPEEKL